MSAVKSEPVPPDDTRRDSCSSKTSSGKQGSNLLLSLPSKKNLICEESRQTVTEVASTRTIRGLSGLGQIWPIPCKDTKSTSLDFPGSSATPAEYAARNSASLESPGEPFEAMPLKDSADHPLMSEDETPRGKPLLITLNLPVNNSKLGVEANLTGAKAGGNNSAQGSQEAGFHEEALENEKCDPAYSPLTPIIEMSQGNSSAVALEGNAVEVSVQLSQSNNHPPMYTNSHQVRHFSQIFPWNQGKLPIAVSAPRNTNIGHQNVMWPAYAQTHVSTQNEQSYQNGIATVNSISPLVTSSVASQQRLVTSLPLFVNSSGEYEAALVLPRNVSSCPDAMAKAPMMSRIAVRTVTQQNGAPVMEVIDHVPAIYVPFNERENHNEKERRRRNRIKASCQALRALVPSLSDKTDKATVFEYTVQYLMHIKRFVGNKYDKEFINKYQPY